MSQLELGTKLLLKPASSIQYNPELELASVFEATLPDNQIIIEAPIHKGVLYMIPLGEILFVYFTDEKGRYDFQCRVIDRFQESDVHFIKAKVLTEISHSQRRDDFRVEKILHGKIILQKRVEGILQKLESDCQSFDISGGGIALYTNEAYEADQNVTLAIPIGYEGALIHLKAEIKWCFPCERPNYTHSTGARFLFADQNESDKMARYVFQLQYDTLQRKHLF